MEAVGGAFTPSREVDELMWISPEGAEALLTRATDREILERFSSGPVRTGMVLLVAHATAGDRNSWKGDDRARPLDENGREQAQELVRLLSRFEVQKLVTADYLRCIETLKPLADSIRLEIEEEPLLSETGFPGHETEAVAAIRRLGDHDEAVAACSQRQVIPDLIRMLADEDGVELPDPFKYKKASVWALSFDGEKLVGTEYFPPPMLD
jgi:8-oxo-dGTP diphosphatase